MLDEFDLMNSDTVFNKGSELNVSNEILIQMNKRFEVLAANVSLDDDSCRIKLCSITQQVIDEFKRRIK